MSKWWLGLIGLIMLAALPARAQMTQVSALVQDANGQHYVNCQWSVVFVGQSTIPGAGPYQPAALLVGQQGHCDSSGNLTVTLADNINTIRPTPSQWNFSICSAPGYIPGDTYCRSNMLVTITGQAQDLTSFFQPLMPLLPGGGNSLTITNPGSFTNTQMNEYVRSIINGCNTTTEQSIYDSYTASGGAMATNAFSACLNIPASAVHLGTAAGFAAYVVNNVTGNSPMAAGVTGACRTLGTNSNCVGSNFTASDASGTLTRAALARRGLPKPKPMRGNARSTGVSLFANITNVIATQAPSAYSAIQGVTSTALFFGTGPYPDSNAFNASTDPVTGNQWSTGYRTEDGAAQYFALLGTASATGTSDSQPILGAMRPAAGAYEVGGLLGFLHAVPSGPCPFQEVEVGINNAATSNSNLLYGCTPANGWQPLGGGGGGGALTGTSATITNPGVFTNTQMNEYVSSTVNGCNTSTEQAVQGLYATNAMSACLTVPATSTVNFANGIASYVQNNLNSYRQVSGMRAQCRLLSGPDADCIGGLFVATDLGNTTSSSAGIALYGLAGEAIATQNASAYQTIEGVTSSAQLMGTGPYITAVAYAAENWSSSPWFQAYFSRDGAAQLFTGIGTTAANGPSDSQPIVGYARTTGADMPGGISFLRATPTGTCPSFPEIGINVFGATNSDLLYGCTPGNTWSAFGGGGGGSFPDLTNTPSTILTSTVPFSWSTNTTKASDNPQFFRYDASTLCFTALATHVADQCLNANTGIRSSLNFAYGWANGNATYQIDTGLWRVSANTVGVGNSSSSTNGALQLTNINFPNNTTISGSNPQWFRSDLYSLCYSAGGDPADQCLSANQGMKLNSNVGYTWTPAAWNASGLFDTGLWRVSPNVVGVGNSLSTPANGTIQATNFVAVGLTPSANPLCANGPGGAFINIGCSGGGGGSLPDLSNTPGSIVTTAVPFSWSANTIFSGTNPQFLRFDPNTLCYAAAGDSADICLSAAGGTGIRTANYGGYTWTAALANATGALDTGLWRVSPNVVGVGNGQSAGSNTNGTLQAQKFSATSSGVFTNTQMNEYVTSVLNGCSTATEQIPLGGNATNAISACLTIPATPTVANTNAIAGYVQDNNQGTIGATAIAGRCRGTVSGAACFASSFINSDSAGLTGMNFTGVDTVSIAANNGGDYTRIQGVTSTAVFHGTGPYLTSAAFTAGGTNATNENNWRTAYKSNDGSALEFANVGTWTAGGTSDSQPIIGNGRNSSGQSMQGSITFYQSAPSGACSGGVYNGVQLGINLAATSASTVLYVCWAGGSWTALQAP